MNIRPNVKQKVAGHAFVGIVGLILGVIVTDGKIAEAAMAGVAGIVIHAIFDQPVTNYIASHPQEFPLFLAQ